jgi:bHLH factor
MTSAQHSSIPAGASTASVGQASPAPVAVVPNGDRIPLQIEGMDAAQVSNLLKNLPSLFHKVCDQ